MESKTWQTFFVSIVVVGLIVTWAGYIAQRHHNRLRKELDAEIQTLRRRLESTTTSIERSISFFPMERLPWSEDDRRQAILAMQRFPETGDRQQTGKNKICEADQLCIKMAGKHTITNRPGSQHMVVTREGQESVKVNGKILSYDDVAVRCLSHLDPPLTLSLILTLPSPSLPSLFPSF